MYESKSLVACIACREKKVKCKNQVKFDQCPESTADKCARTKAVEDTRAHDVS